MPQRHIVRGKMKKSLKKGVLIIVENLPVPFDRRVWLEARALYDAGYAVYVICPIGKDFSKRRETIDGIEVYRHSLPIEADNMLQYAGEYLWALTAEMYLAFRICLTRRVDIVHACNPPDTIFIIGMILKLFGKRFVFDHHDVCPELFEAKFGKQGMGYRIARLLEKWTFRVADISIATNESYREIAIERGGMSADKVFVVRSGPNLDQVRNVPTDDRWKQNRQYLVSYVGVMGKQEGLELLIGSIKIIVEEFGRTDIHFCLVGGGTELDSLKQQAIDIGVDDFVTFTGRVPDGELLEILSTADVCVNPDRVNEMNSKSTMNKVLEYMALGKPIVQFEMVEGRVSAGLSALYAAPNDETDFARQISKLVDDPSLRHEMGEIGRERINDGLSWAHQSNNLIAAYSSLVQDGA